MRIRDLPGWPPVWAISYTGAERLPVTERGILVEAEPRLGAVIILTAACDGRIASGVLPVRPELVGRVLEVLRAHRGRPLTAVGGAEIPDG